MSWIVGRTRLTQRLSLTSLGGELNKFDLVYKLRSAIKDQAFIDFMAEFAKALMVGRVIGIDRALYLELFLLMAHQDKPALGQEWS